ncbi:MAG: hypothetical protein KatS3mg011_0981 [Acidimicrobiia bacterium]|nr:MAG: hypothetical protein KatS3mg011_0981 [Acidimicrobiia bacterium]
MMNCRKLAVGWFAVAVLVLQVGCGPVPGKPSDQAADLPEPRTEVSGVAWGDSIVVLGGMTADGTPTRRVDIYDPARDRWHRGPDLPTPLHHTTATVAEGRLYVAGGFTTEWTPTAEVWSLGPDDDDWRTEPPLGTARGAAAAAGDGSAIMILGGVDGTGRVLSSVEVWTGTRWEPGPELSQPRSTSLRFGPQMASSRWEAEPAASTPTSPPSRCSEADCGNRDLR